MSSNVFLRRYSSKAAWNCLPSLSSFRPDRKWTFGDKRWIKSAALGLGLSVVASTSVALADSNRYRGPNRADKRRQERTAYGTNLCRAVRRGDLSEVKRMLTKSEETDSFVDPDARHSCGWGPLHVAAANNQLDMAKFLLEQGCDPNLQDMTSPYAGQIRKQEFSERIHAQAPTQKFTPLHYAAALFDSDMVSLLISQGADPDRTDARGFTAVDYIRSTDDPKAIALVNQIAQDRETYLVEKEARDRQERLQHPIEDRLKERIVGQLRPIRDVSAAVRRKLNGWQDGDHPLVFLFLGSSGVGKTELAKTLASVLHDDEKHFIRVDMSEFQHKHEVAKFIGSPPGYVGHEEGGQLTKKLRECPDAVVLLDEVEKAHPDVLTIMLQLFDEGRITDGKGETVHCKDAIFVMTSNLAQTEIGDEAEGLRKHDASHRRFETEQTENDTQSVDDGGITLSRTFIEETIQPILKRHFQRDEFLGRINEILYFLPFSGSELKELTIRELNKWKTIARERHGVELEWDDSAVELLRDGYNFRYGARSLQHEVDKRVINQLAALHERDEIGNGSKVSVTTKTVEAEQKSEEDASSTTQLISLQYKAGEHKAAKTSWLFG